MTGEVYKVLLVDGEKVLCIDTTDGFILKIGGQKYHVYADADGSTHVDLVMSDDKCFFDEGEYIGKVNDQWTGDEEEAARYILK